VSGTPILLNYPGLFNQTKGRKIPIRARIGLHSGKLVQRSTYRARIGGGTDRDNEGSGAGFYGVRVALDVPGISKFFLHFFL